MSDRKNLGKLEQIFFIALSVLIGRYVLDATVAMPSWVMVMIAMFLISYFALLAYVEISTHLDHLRKLTILRLPEAKKVEPVETSTESA